MQRMNFEGKFRALHTSNIHFPSVGERSGPEAPTLEIWGHYIDFPATPLIGRRLTSHLKPFRPNRRQEAA
jgi:hypothetical protein